MRDWLETDKWSFKYVYCYYFQVDLFWSYIYLIVFWFGWFIDFVVSIHFILNNWDLLIKIHIRSICEAYLLRCRWKTKFTPGQKVFCISLHLCFWSLPEHRTLSPHAWHIEDISTKISYYLMIGKWQDACFWTHCRHLPWVHNWERYPHRMTDQLLVCHFLVPGGWL